MPENSIVNLGALTKPATVLIKKISKAVGGVFEPHQIVRLAKAETEADLIRAQSTIQVTDLHRRAVHRFIEEEACRQRNMEHITERALPLVTNEAGAESLDEDWLRNFFEKCRLIADDEMQQIWGKILAGQANEPESISKKTVNLLYDLGKRDAELFQVLIGFSWNFGRITPLIFWNSDQKFYESRGLGFEDFVHLENLGLLRFDTLRGFRLTNLGNRIRGTYHEVSQELVFPTDSGNELDVGAVILTRAGAQVARVCKSVPNEGFVELVLTRWQGLLAGAQVTAAVDGQTVPSLPSAPQ